MATFLSRNRNRGWLVCVVVAAGLIGGAVWILQDVTRCSSAEREEPAGAAAYALAVNGDEISYESLAVLARRAETSYLTDQGLTPSAFQGAAAAYLRMAFLRDAVVTLTEQTLVVQEARARGITANEKRVEEDATRAFEQLVTQTGGSVDDLVRSLVETGQTLDEFKASLRDEAQLHLLEDAVTLAVVGEIAVSDADLYAFYESKKDSYGSSFESARDRVRSDYNRDEVARRRDEWLSTKVAAATVTIALPILDAFYQIAAGKGDGLAQLERLLEEKVVFDPYLPYYIGRLYYERALSAFAERRDLEAAAGATPSSEQLARIQVLQQQEDESVAKALAAYEEVLKNGVEDDEALLSRVLQLGPEPAVRSLLLGLASLTRGDATAEERLRKAIEQDEDLAVARLALGDLAARDGDAAKALAWYEEEVALSPDDVDVVLRVAESLMALGSFDEAESRVDTARALAPGYVRLRIVAGDLALNRLNAAVKERDLLQGQATRTASDEARLTALGQEIADLNGDARGLYEEALAKGAGEEVLVKLGNVELLVGEHEAAAETFRTVLRRSTHYPEAHVGLGDALVALGDAEAATAHYDAAMAGALNARQLEGILLRVLQADPSNRSARLLYGVALARQGRWRDAIQELLKVLEADPSVVEAQLWIAESFTSLGDYASAYGYLERGLGAATTATQRESACAQVLSTVTRESQSWATPSSAALDALILVAQTRLAAGNRSGAEDALEWLLALSPSYRQAEVRALLEQTR